MGSRRLGRGRLANLNQFGQNSTSTAQPGIVDAIASQTELRDGSLMTTDIQIDLGTSLRAINSFAGVGAENAGGSTVIGSGSLSSSIMLVAPAQGILAQAELVCVEPPAGGETRIGVLYADNVLSASMSMAQATNPVVLLANENYTAAGDIAVNDDISADIDGKYIYLCASGSTNDTYTAGKFILRLHGYELFADF